MDPYFLRDSRHILPDKAMKFKITTNFAILGTLLRPQQPTTGLSIFEKKQSDVFKYVLLQFMHSISSET